MTIYKAGQQVWIAYTLAQFKAKVTRVIPGTTYAPAQVFVEDEQGMALGHLSG